MSVRNKFDIEAVLTAMDAIEFGAVHWFNGDQGFGFITGDVGGPDIVVHHSEIVGEHPRALEGGQRVSYRLGGTSQRPQAETVHVL
ncbi:MAG: cold shock domain-containing protein [Mycobacterium sp.]